jgi:hypothetical protein
MKIENRLIKYLESIEVGVDGMNMATLGPEELKNEMIQKFLLSFDEFKNVKKINALEAPSYLVDTKTGAPIEKDESNLGDKNKVKSYAVPSFIYNPNRDLYFEFNEEIDLYSISLSPKIYNPEELTSFNLGVGTWVMPTMYDPANFTPLREIKVVFSPEAIQDILGLKNKEDGDKEVKKRLLKSFEDAIDNGLVENVPYSRNIMFRMSERSIKKGLVEKK